MRRRTNSSFRRQEARNIWLALSILLLLVTYRLAVYLQPAMQAFFDLLTEMPIADWVTNALFLWLMLLLWLAYRRWRQSMARARELDTIITSIGPDVLIVIDAERTIRLCNGAIQSMYGYTVDEVIGAKTDVLYFDRRLDKGKNEIRDDLRKRGYHVGRAKGKRRDGNIFPLEVITATLRETPGAVLLLRDITERAKLEKQLVVLSTHDELTGLYNRRGFFEAANQQLEFARRYHLKMFLLYLDLNKFKAINDTHGHQAGDDALKAVAELLIAKLRSADIVGRLGGDEYAVFGAAIEERTPERLAERLRAAFAAYVDPERRFQLSASIGTASFDPASARSLNDLTSEADARMYEEKARRPAS